MRIKVLGTAAGGGVPQWNCGCTNCRATREGKLARRRVASAALSANESDWTLVNASCDISEQLAEALLWPPAQHKRASPIAAVFLTDANIDHTAGLLELRQGENLTIYSTALVREVLCASPMFAQLATRFAWRPIGDESSCVELDEAAGMRVWAIPVDGLLPSYAGGARCSGAAVAYRFEQSGACIVYAPIFLALDASLHRELEGTDAVFLDGTCWTDDEMLALGLGRRSAREMGHQPMSGPGGSLERVLGLSTRYRYYTHVNNSNPILDPASAAAHELAHAGFSVPDDGLEIALDGEHKTGLNSGKHLR
jgi:pyrroloquinoline quinone biosynthesis protein B